MMLPKAIATLFPYTTLFRSIEEHQRVVADVVYWRRIGVRDLFGQNRARFRRIAECARTRERSEEHTSELQSHSDLVCRLQLEKKSTGTVAAARLSVETFSIV